MVTKPAPDDRYVFVSYASVDHARVEPLVAALARAGVPVWMDRHDIEGGENYALQIAEGIEHCAALIIMCSTSSLASRNVRQEIALGWKYERTYLPLVLEPMTIPKEVEYWLEAAQWVEVLDTPEKAWLPRLLAALEPLGISPNADHGDAVLVGREREQTILRARLTAAIGGQGSLVLIGGEAGIGKTTLAEALCREAARQGALVLTGRCFDLAETPPYGPWLYLCERYPASDTLPPLPTVFAEPGRIGEITSQAALFRQVLDFIKAVAVARPLVLVLDDYHWADPASLDLLRYLAQSIATLPVLLLVTYRSDELTRRHPLYQMLPLLVREAGAARLDLRCLDDDAVRTLIAERYGLAESDTARLASYLQARAEGNALFLGELLRSLEEAGVLRQADNAWALGELTQAAVPPLLRQVIDGRLERLDEESQRLLGVAAVIGHEVPLDVWATVGAVDEDALLDVIEQSIEARLLVESSDGERVQFAHALIRETLYEGMLTTRRRRMHRQVGEALAATPNPDPDAVAYHFQQAGEARAVEWLVRAGERAQLAYAWITASERYEAALGLIEGSGDDVARQGWLQYRIARLRRWSTPEQSVGYLDEALRIAAVIGDRALDAAARYTRGLCLYYATERQAGIREVAAGCDALEALPPDEQERLDLAPDAQGQPTITNPRGMLIWALASNGPIAEALTMGEATQEGVPRHTPLGEVGLAHYGDRYAGLGTAYALAGRPTEARHAFERARDCYRLLGNYATYGGASTFDLLLVSLPYFADRLGDRERLAEVATDARRRSSATSDAYDRLAHLPVLALAGRWGEAEEGAEATLGHIQWQPGWRTIANVVLADLTHAQGKPDAAWAHIRHLLPSGPHTTPGAEMWFIGLPLLRIAAALSLDAGDLDTAREWLEAHDRWLTSSGAVLGQSDGEALWAQYHRQSGDTEQTYAHAEHALAHATEPRQPLALIAAHRLLGELDTDAGRYDDAVTHLDASLALADACAAPYERALTLLTMAELRAAMGEHDAARSLIDEVRAICVPLGAKPALAKAGALAARLAV